MSKLGIGKVALIVFSMSIVVNLGAQSAPRFELASIRPSDREQGLLNSTTPSLNVDGGRYLRFTQITLRDLIMLAYGIGTAQVDGPAFLNGRPDSPADRFDVAARVPVGSAREDVPLMLRALLAERFHLTAHRDNKVMQIYALEVAKGGLKMKESPEGATGAAGCSRSLAQREGATLAAICSRVTSRDIVQQVQALAPGYFRDGPVVDLSNLKGVYDFKLEWITVAQANSGGPGPSMINAVEEQLGLRLERRREPVEVLVVDTLDRMPTEN